MTSGASSMVSSHSVLSKIARAGCVLVAGLIQRSGRSNNAAWVTSSTVSPASVGADSDEGGHLFQSDRGHRSDLMAASLVSSRGPVLVMSQRCSRGQAVAHGLARKIRLRSAKQS